MTTRTENSDGAVIKDGMITYRAINHPIPEPFLSRLIEAGLAKDTAGIRLIEHTLRNMGPEVTRRVARSYGS